MPQRLANLRQKSCTITITTVTKTTTKIAASIDHNEKDGGCTFYQNALLSEMV